MKPFIPGHTPYDIVLGNTSAKEVQDAIAEWSLLHPEAEEVHIKRGACPDCEVNAKQFAKVHTIRI
jgi:hypothetical protein